ncbi:MAG TPA: FAD-binding oxidoreductase [Acidobacteriota bacterium]|nr:FAD-binding oxidoreductase [Acidobacteriota bacterium]
MLTTAYDVAQLDGKHVRLSRAELQEFRSIVEGPVFGPDDQRWDSATLLWNGMMTGKPALVFQPASAQDVATALGFARDRQIMISVKGGGHNIAGTAIAPDGFMLDMCGMNKAMVDPDARVVHVGPGCRLKDVDRATQQHGLATVLGFISDVGVAGLVLGGGLGYLTRRFGWSVDNLEEVEIVTAGGEVHIANREKNADLFWALRGGGGNFGVVTRFTLRLHPVGPQVYGGLIAWPFERAEEIADCYRDLTVSAPRELSVWMVLLCAPPAPFVPVQWRGRRICGMAVCYSGELGAADSALAPIRSLGEPVFDLLGEQPYTQVQSYLDDTEPKGYHYYWKTEYLASLSDGVLSTLRELFADCPIPQADIGLLHLGGALNERQADDGAVGNRDARYVVGVKGMWPPGEPKAEEFRQWVRYAGDRVHPFSTGGNYINFQTADEDDHRVKASYGTNFRRLTEIKKKYDPDNLFRVNRNINPRKEA